MENPASPISNSKKLHTAMAGCSQAYIVVPCHLPIDAGRSASFAAFAYAKIGEFLETRGMGILHEIVFGSLTVRDAVLSARNDALKKHGISTESSVTYIQGHPPWGKGFAGAIVQTVACNEPHHEIELIMDGAVSCGRIWRRKGYAYLTLQSIHGLKGDPEKGNGYEEQTERMFERAERILLEQGFSYDDVIRTWFYLPEILDWYDDFNTFRNAKYTALGIMPGPETGPLVLPASTGIQGRTVDSPAVSLDLLALHRTKESLPEIMQLSNPLQKEAFEYGSAFSRGALIREPDVKTLHISGTAAIDEAGSSLFPGDVFKQIDSTLDKIEALLDQEGAALNDICAATLYVKRPEDAPLCLNLAYMRGLHVDKTICVVADVCRDELLCEIDAVAVFDPSC